MVFGGLFSFDANKETPQSAAQRRALAEAIMGRSMSPKNVGEGFGAIASGIVANVERGRASAAESAGQASANSTFSNIANMITGQGGSAGGGALGAANEVGQAAPTTSNFSGSQQEFIDMLMPTALEVSAETGIDPRIIVAQAAQETGWGRSAPGNNFFGIKSHGQSGGQTLNTHEYINGERVNVSDSFRTFGSPEDSVRGYGEFIRSNPRYGDFMAAQGLDAQLDALQASGYATDPNYSQSVGSIARGIALPQQPTQVASVDPTMNMVITPEMHAAFSAANPDDLVATLPNTATASADPSVMTRTLPFRPGGDAAGPSQADLPPNAAPGTVAQGLDGQTYMYAETSGMAGATGPQGWIPYSGGQSAPANSGIDLGYLMDAAQNPWLNEGQRGMINALIQQELQRMDPQYQQGLAQGDVNLRRSEFELDQMMNPPAPFQPTPMSPEEMASWGIPEGSGSWTIGEDGMPQQIFEPSSDPTSVQEYEYYLQQAEALGQQPVPYVEWDNARKAAGATNISNIVGGESGPKLGSLSSDYGYVLDPETGQPVIDDETGLPTAAPVPGSPAAREIEAAQAQTDSRDAQAATQAGTVTQDTGIALQGLGELGGLSADNGPAGANWRRLQAGIAGTPEHRIQKFVNSALANVGFDQLNQMRQNSPTGGALGNVTELQLRQLESVLGQYDIGLPIEDQKFILQRISNIYSDVIFGSRAERDLAVREGKMTPEQADLYDQYYYPETRDAMGRPLEQSPAPSQSQPSGDIDDILRGYGL